MCTKNILNLAGKLNLYGEIYCIQQKLNDSFMRKLYLYLKLCINIFFNSSLIYASPVTINLRDSITSSLPLYVLLLGEVFHQQRLPEINFPIYFIRQIRFSWVSILLPTHAIRKMSILLQGSYQDEQRWLYFIQITLQNTTLLLLIELLFVSFGSQAIPSTKNGKKNIPRRELVHRENRKLLLFSRA